MIRTIYNSRFRDHKSGKAPLRGQRPGPRDASQRRDTPARREGGPRRENSTVVHPWMSLPERLAATQAAMRELAGNAAFQCPLGDAFVGPAPAGTHASPVPSEQKPKTTGPGGVHVVIRKRRLPAGVIASLTSVG